MSQDTKKLVPTFQRILSPATARPHHRRWLCVAVRDDDFDVSSVVVGDQDGCRLVTLDLKNVPYEDFWRALAGLKLWPRKWWLIGHRMRYLLHQSDWLGALERGEIKLPQRRNKQGDLKRSGRCAVGDQVLDLDLIVGKHKLRVLDWSQLGVKEDALPAPINQMVGEDAADLLTDYLVLCNKTGLSASRTTAAQVGWSRYRTHDMSDYPHVNACEDSRALERRAYFGGRNEVYRLGKIQSKGYSLDVRSCYAAICMGCTVPTRQLEFYPHGLDYRELALTHGEHWIADVVIKTDTPDYPVRYCGRVIYPVGTFYTTLCWPELCRALIGNRVVKIVRAARYAAKHALRRHAQWYLAARGLIASSPVRYLDGALKAAFNAGLGFAARRKYEWQPWSTEIPHRFIVGTTVDPADHSACVQCHILDSEAEWLAVGGEPNEALPYLHATITSWARTRLLSIMNDAGEGNVYYCDTDGILCNGTGMDRLSKAGWLKDERSGGLTERFVSGDLEIRGLKNYRLGESIICAGSPEFRRNEWSTDGAYQTVEVWDAEQQRKVLRVEPVSLTTPTGLVDSHGVVTPFRLTCEDEGGENPRWANWMD